METIYLILVVALFVLAISDLIVGVSNDAVNFLNAAAGSKVSNYRNILIVAALGVLVGATFSSGMMEVARKGIFYPQNFMFKEIMLIFMAVMITDVILLDTFNTFGMPTSTTVSIVFELLGAAVAVAVIKIYAQGSELAITDYINTGTALKIIFGILLSVVVAFSVGAFVMYLSRLLFSFDYSKKLKYYGAIWGALILTGITYFILIKGAKGASFMSSDLKSYIKGNAGTIMLISFCTWAIVLQALLFVKRFNMLKLIVMAGTFALAMAFAGNDLVNFIGVPLAGYEAFKIYMADGNVLMEALNGKVSTPTVFLLFAGLIMVLTLWTSKKAKSVIKTSLDLGRQEEGYERFGSSLAARGVVRSFSNASNNIRKILPFLGSKSIEAKFDQAHFIKEQKKYAEGEAPSFDLIRAAVTLFVASILISIGTALKLPLSTTYVTFMVAMGTSLADGAWGRESAVYRVSGVLNVVGGWFFTAFSAFTAAFILANIFYFVGLGAIGIAVILAAYLIYRTNILHKNRNTKTEDFEQEYKNGITQNVLLEKTEKQITKYNAQLINLLNTYQTDLAIENRKGINKTYKKFKELHNKIKSTQNKVSRTIDKLTEDSMESGHYYVIIIDYLKKLSQTTNQVLYTGLMHLENNHKSLNDIQKDELKQILELLNDQVNYQHSQISSRTYKNIEENTKELLKIQQLIRQFRKNQIRRIKDREVGTRNSLLFLNHLAEFRNLSIYNYNITKYHKEFIDYINTGDANLNKF